MTDTQVRALEADHFSRMKKGGTLLGPGGHPLRPEAGIQISLRLPVPVLAKLTRLSEAAVQTKSQYITKLIAELSDGQPQSG